MFCCSCFGSKSDGDFGFDGTERLLPSGAAVSRSPTYAEINDGVSPSGAAIAKSPTYAEIDGDLRYYAYDDAEPPLPPLPGASGHRRSSPNGRAAVVEPTPPRPTPYRSPSLPLPPLPGASGHRRSSPNDDDPYDDDSGGSGKKIVKAPTYDDPYDDDSGGSGKKIIKAPIYVDPYNRDALTLTSDLSFNDQGNVSINPSSTSIQKLGSHTSQNTVVNDGYDDWAADTAGITASLTSSAFGGFNDDAVLPPADTADITVSLTSSAFGGFDDDAVLPPAARATAKGIRTPTPASSSNYPASPTEMRIAATGRWRDDPAGLASLQQALGRRIELIQQDDEAELAAQCARAIVATQSHSKRGLTLYVEAGRGSTQFTVLDPLGAVVHRSDADGFPKADPVPYAKKRRAATRVAEDHGARIELVVAYGSLWFILDNAGAPVVGDGAALPGTVHAVGRDFHALGFLSDTFASTKMLVIRNVMTPDGQLRKVTWGGGFAAPFLDLGSGKAAVVDPVTGTQSQNVDLPDDIGAVAALLRNMLSEQPAPHDSDDAAVAAGSPSPPWVPNESVYARVPENERTAATRHGTDLDL